jgi:hypothetical protein
MSYAAINAVTRGLRMMLFSQLVRISSSAVVTLLPPGDALPEASGVNLYLYRVAESPFSRNQPWPGDRATPPSNRPALGLFLYYLLTPLGPRPDDSSVNQGDDAHTMLGLAMGALQENPILNNAHLPALAASGALNATPGFEADTALPDFLLNSYEQVKITLMQTTVEELSKIWATINQPYRLSIAYEVSLVQITPTPPPPVNGGIVTRTGLTVFQLSAPLLQNVSPPSGALVHVGLGGVLLPNTLTIDGSGFSFPGQTPTVTVGGQPVSLVLASPPASLVVNLPADLDAGPQEDVKVTLNGRTSTPLSFIVNPWLASITPLRTELPAGQKLTLQGLGFTTTPQGARLDGAGAPPGVTPFDAGVTDTQGTIAVPPALPNGLYQVRVVLNDLAASASNSRTLEIIPRIDTTSLGVSSPPAVHMLTVNGARLAGADVRVLLDSVTYQTGPNANPAQLVYTFGRLLSPGPHAVSVNVDGHASHTVNLEA